MAVVIRLQRRGKKKEAHYLIVATDKRESVSGQALEILGHFHPTMEKNQITINKERLDHWIKNDAKPSATVASIIRKSQKK